MSWSIGEYLANAHARQYLCLHLCALSCIYAYVFTTHRELARSHLLCNGVSVCKEVKVEDVGASNSRQASDGS